jgi:regulator of protease activity HflC (stomatin/prohibitin superfamily)
MTELKNARQNQYEEVAPRHGSGMAALLLNLLAMLASTGLCILGIIRAEGGAGAMGAALITVSLLYLCVAGPIIFGGLKILKPKEALVLTLFGKYTGTLKGEGFFFVNPFSTAVSPNTGPAANAVATTETPKEGRSRAAQDYFVQKRKISLKAMTLNNSLQKINDQLGNPIIIGIVVIWRVVNTAMAVFNVDNFKEFLSIQCDSALRNIVRLYPYDVSGDDEEKTLRSSSQEIAEKLKAEIQDKTALAGLEIIEARITHLSYAPEIAAAMLQRQQASAIIDARQMIVEGAVGMVEMALDKLSKREIVQLDEERKAAMVSNLLVVLCGNRDAQPVVNSGTLY